MFRPIQKKLNTNSGFTLIELLVVIAIIGLLASIITTSMNNARLKSRDAKRLSDAKQIKTGLDLYYANGGGYPSEATFNASYTGGTFLSCNNTPVMRVTQDPSYPNMQYTYTVSGSTVSGCGLADLRLKYTLTFVLEKTPSITYSMNEDGQFTPTLPQ
ncbi:MAG: prepilin-type N-terminal cleavage/methylation domain-containing protein [bacterium]|nr:prepilin-type N-terminal cleavage/methylation domain-containing protein [bacterium]